MDFRAAADEVREFIAVVDASKPMAVHRFSPREREWREANDRVLHRLPMIISIAQASGGVNVELFKQDGGAGWTWASARTGAQVLLGHLESADRRAAIIGAGGPQLAAQHLHRWVWEPAATRWAAGQRRDAIQAAATNVFDNHLAAKLQIGPDSRGGKDLAGQAFSTKDPEPGRFRLRLTDYAEGSKDWISAHEGAMSLGQACAQLIRNLRTHTLTEPAPDEALEMLATLSLFARVVDDAIPVTTS